ncbi:MAG: beta-propeller fold lactonase family protein, partial [Massilia sp.]|nr:beta-propeller fold lactonase family protein [Massilia sp.]
MLRRFRKSFRRSLIAGFTFFSAVQAAHANVVVVLNSRDATVQLLDQTTGADNGTFAVGKEPHHLMATPDNKSVIVASSVGNELIFLDPVTGKVQRRLADVLDPYQIGFSPDQKWFVSASLRLDRVDVYKYDAGNLTLSKRLPLARMPSHIAFDAASTTAFITQQGSDQVSAI